MNDAGYKRVSNAELSRLNALVFTGDLSDASDNRYRHLWQQVGERMRAVATASGFAEIATNEEAIRGWNSPLILAVYKNEADEYMNAWLGGEDVITVGFDDYIDWWVHRDEE